jgi:hypothetical protein
VPSSGDWQTRREEIPMREVEGELRRLLLERTRDVPLSRIAKESGINRPVLALAKNQRRPFSKETIDKLRDYLELDLALVQRLKPRLRGHGASHDGEGEH